jgi:AcrR family transcriptional regulator
VAVLNDPLRDGDPLTLGAEMGEKGAMPRARSAKPADGEGKTGATPPLTVKEQILDRTIYLIGRKGTTDVTVREIAREAGVNVAAVNYYFSSKEEMFEQMAQRFLAGYDEVMRTLETPGMPATERLRRWSGEVMRHLADYPGFLPVMERHMTAEPLDPFGRALRVAMQRAVRQLKAVLRECVLGADEGRIGFKLTLLISALAGPFPRLVGPTQERPAGRASTAREKFLDLMLEHLQR